MRWLILLLLLVPAGSISGCASGNPEVPDTSGFSPTLYVQFECDHPEGGCVRPGEVILDPDWPPVVCLGETE